MVLMVSLSWRISPLASTVIFFERSPPATAVVTSAMLRTWLVRLEAMELTLSVRSFQAPPAPFTFAWPPSLPSVPTSRNAGHFGSKGVELAHHGVDGLLELKKLSLYPDRDLAGEVASCNSGCDFRDVADLVGEVRGHGVHVVGEVLPRSGDPLHLGLAAELPLGADV